MKKTLLALSVLVASTAANAGIEVYNKDGATVTMSGDMEVRYAKDTVKDSKTQQEFNDADLKFDVRYAVSDDLAVGAVWEFQGDSGSTTEGSTVGTGDVYFAFYHAAAGSLKIGELCNIADDLGVGNDYKFGISSRVDAAEACGDETVRWDYSNDMFSAGVAFRDDQRSDDTDPDLLDAYVGFDVAGLNLLAYYGTSSSVDLDAFAVEARYNIDALELAAGYYDVEDTSDTVAVSVQYTIDKVTVGAGYSDSSRDAGNDESNLYVNAGYAIAKSTTLYVEVADKDEDGVDSDVGYVVGAKVAF